MSVLVLIEGRVRPEALDELRAFMEEALPEARSHEGCQSLQVYADQAEPADWIWVERWASRQHYERYMARRAQTGAVDQMAAMFSAPLSMRFFDPVEGLNAGPSCPSDAGPESASGAAGDGEDSLSHVDCSPMEGALRQKRRGHYLGTEVDGKWWKRYARAGFLARGTGEYWWDDEAFRFRRYLAHDPLSIPYEKVSDLRVGTWHSGHWAWGRPVVKFLWSDGGRALSSGFVLPAERPEVQVYVCEMRQRLSGASAAVGGC